MTDTIFAQATPPGRSAVAVFRVSGPAAARCAEALGAHRTRPRVASLRRLFDPRDGRLLDEALVLRFEAPASFTGEDALELQVHGGPAVCRSIAAALGALDGLRQAEPGEFTRRALLNGKLDLSQVEGVADLLAAESSLQASQALALASGELSAQAQRWCNTLISALAGLEAVIDHADEDLPEGTVTATAGALHAMAKDLERELAGSGISERLRSGFDIALVGAPNVGKSTLLNALAGRDAAITSEHAGTTRDVIEVRMDLGGVPVSVLDMAGIRDGGDAIEALGRARAQQRARDADLRVFLVDELLDAGCLGVDLQPGDQVILSKSDQRSFAAAPAVSGLTGSGIPELLQGMKRELAGRLATRGMISRERQQAALERALAAALSAVGHLEWPDPDVDLAVAEVRSILGALDDLLGKVDVEAVLDEIFKSFCLGK